MKKVLLASLLAVASIASQAHDGSVGSIRGPGELSVGVVGGSLLVAGAAGSVVVESVKTAGDGIEVVVKGGSEASTATLRFSGTAAGGLSLATGTVVEVVAMSAGQALVASGKVLAFIPNESGKALLHHSKVN
ncbi:hypothetical protein [Pseudoduganella sp. RAF53_2]|uniref:hypothetical protein n=1 Tax=unclassified Pseudoduganella TaxID=2637179 RepID=UPI003F9729A1